MRGGALGGGVAVVLIAFKHFRRRDYNMYAVDVPEELPASAKRMKKSLDSATNPLWARSGSQSWMARGVAPRSSSRQRAR